MSPCSLLAGLEMDEAHQVDFDPVYRITDAARVRILEIHAGNGRENVDSQGRSSHPDEATPVLEELRRDVWRVESERADGRHRPLGISRVGRDPDFEVVCRPRVAVVGDGVSTDDKVPNAVDPQQPQKLFEVGR